MIAGLNDCVGLGVKFVSAYIVSLAFKYLFSVLFLAALCDTL